MKNWQHTLFRRLILFLVGFCVYITIEVCFRGYSYITSGFMGGILLLLIDPINDRISWDINLLLYGCIGSLIITLMELIIGEFLKYFDFLPMWNYTNMPLNYDGVICLPFSLLWILLSIVGIFVADTINYYVFGELPVPYYKICGKTVLTFKEKGN